MRRAASVRTAALPVVVAMAVAGEAAEAEVELASRAAVTALMASRICADSSGVTCGAARSACGTSARGGASDSAVGGVGAVGVAGAGVCADDDESRSIDRGAASQGRQS